MVQFRLLRAPLLVAVALVATSLALLAPPGAASNHEACGAPDDTPATLLVDKSDPSAYATLQAAVDAATPGDTVLVAPGTYDDVVFDYDGSGKTATVVVTTCHLTIRGMDREGVVLDGGADVTDPACASGTHYGIFVDEADDVTIDNLTVVNYRNYGLYYYNMEGFWIYRVTAGNACVYPILTHDASTGEIAYSEAYGGGDSGIYTGETSDCDCVLHHNNVHDNVIGFSGTKGNHVVIRQNWFHDNTVGILPNTLTPDVAHYVSEHVGPGKDAAVQCCSTIAYNLIENNNNGDVIPHGFTEDIRVPRGTGIELGGASGNAVYGNIIRGHDRWGVAVHWLFVPPNSNLVTGNVFLDNGEYDIWWDEWGVGNCFQDNEYAYATPENLPACGPLPSAGVPNAQKDAELVLIALGHNVGLEEAPLSATGRWLAPVEGEVAAVNMAVLPDGRVLYYSGVEANEADGLLDATFLTSEPRWAEARVFDPVTGAVAATDPVDGGGGDLFCSGTTVLADGRVLAAGGSEWYTLPDTATPVKGVKDTRFFDPEAGLWEAGPDMSVRRWYPSVIELADGRALVASGIKNLTDPSTHNSIVEILDGGAWVPLTTTLHTEGDVELQPMNLPMYPRLLVVPGGPLKGDVFYSTVGTLWGPFGERPDEAIWSIQQSLDVETGAWTWEGPSVFGARQHAAAVPLLLDPARAYAPEILTFGGTLQRSILATPLAEIADLSTDPPTNYPVAPMSNGRWHLNGVLLPDGSVLAVGGAVYDNVVVHGQEDPGVLVTERYDPATETWETLASQSVARGYHSTAVLLPDGRVLSGGHVPLPNPFQPLRATVNPQTVETRLEIFEPPYLFLDDPASRPTITSAPASVAYNATFTVSVANLETTLHSAVLIRPGATTHSFDADQRGILLESSFDEATGTLYLRAPPDGDVAPPGTYMLFVNENVDGQAFPSKSVMIEVK